MNISYEGIDYLAITVPAGNCVVGQASAFDGQGNLVQCAAGGQFCGVVQAMDNGMASLQIEGFVKLPYTGSAPNPGYVNLVGNGSGGVETDISGAPRLVVKTDTTNKTLIFKL